MDRAAGLGNNNDKKLRGGYYTPKPIADFLSEWAIRSPHALVLEPSCGDGAILESAVKRLIKVGANKKKICGSVLGVEINEQEASKAVHKLSFLGVKSAEKVVHIGDFFQYCSSSLLGRRNFDVVIGNPPFLRFQDFSGEMRNQAFDMMRNAQLNPSGFTNSWVPFLVCSSLLLSEKGRLAMIVPAELFQVDYAAETRKFLSRHYSRLALLTFEKLMFREALQEIVILLGEKNYTGQKGIRVAEFRDMRRLEEETPSVSRVLSTLFSSTDLKPLDHTTDKWTQYFLENDEISLLRELRKNPSLRRCGDLFQVDIGVVTGKNKYFVLASKEADERSLRNHVTDIVCNSSSLKGIRFTDKDWTEALGREVPAYLFQPPAFSFKSMPKPVRSYIERGRRNRVNHGYKCRTRRKWYQVPSTWVPDGFMLRQVHMYPKIVLNETNATCTDTIHRIRLLHGIDGKQTAAASLNSLTFAFAETMGRSYGGGILTLEPSEAESLLIPLAGSEQLDFDRIDSLVRGNRIQEILNITDKILIEDGLGLDNHELRMLHNIWFKLKNRRLNRRVKG